MSSLQKLLGVCIRSRIKLPVSCMSACRNRYLMSHASSEKKQLHTSRCLYANYSLPNIEFMLTDYLGDTETISLLRPMKTKFNEMKLKNHIKSYSREELLKMCTKTILHISNCIADGRFGELEGFVDFELLSNIRKRYGKLTPAEKNYLRIKEDYLVLKDVDSIEIQTDSDTKSVSVEIVVALVGTHGRKDFLANHPKHVDLCEPFSCIYSFYSEISEKENSIWKVTNLNHVNPYNKATHV